MPIELRDSVESCNSLDDVRRNVDAANLAIYLARNQLQQGLVERADEALGHALNCLQSLEQSLASNSIPDFHESASVVRESAATWPPAQGKQQSLLVECRESVTKFANISNRLVSARLRCLTKYRLSNCYEKFNNPKLYCCLTTSQRRMVSWSVESVESRYDYPAFAALAKTCRPSRLPDKA